MDSEGWVTLFSRDVDESLNQGLPETSSSDSPRRWVVINALGVTNCAPAPKTRGEGGPGKGEISRVDDTSRV